MKDAAPPWAQKRSNIPIDINFIKSQRKYLEISNDIKGSLRNYRPAFLRAWPADTDFSADNIAVMD